MLRVCEHDTSILLLIFMTLRFVCDVHKPNKLLEGSEN